MVLAARADDDEIVLPGRCFAENLRSRLAGLDDGPKLDASLPQNAGLAIESLTQRLVVGWVLDDAEEGDWGFGYSGQHTAEVRGAVRSGCTVATN